MSILNPKRPNRRRLNLALPLPPHDSSPYVPLPLPLPPPPPMSSSATSHTAANTPSLSDLDRERLLGSGAGGTVWLVRHRPTNLLYALKLLHNQHDDAVRLQIRREIEILRAVQNPFVVPCHAMFDHGGQIQILLEYMDCGSLENRHITNEPFLSHIAKQVLSGLAYLHRHRIVHRDIKPSNLLINTKHQVKIADFGVGRILACTIDPCKSSVGTVSYMSPERINTDLNDGVYDGYAGDIWSFGLSMLEFYMGKFPYGEQLRGQEGWASLMCAICFSNPPQAPVSASDDFRSFISSCLQMEPNRRRTAQQLLQHPFITQTQQMI